MVFAQRDIGHYLTSKYSERDLLWATSKALDSIENEKVHKLWSSLLLGRIAEFPTEVVELFVPYFASDSDFSNDGIHYLRQMADSDFDPEWYIRLYDVNKIHSYFRELRMSLRCVNIYIGTLRENIKCILVL